MSLIKKKQRIKIPSNIKVFYHYKKKLLVFKGTGNQKSLKINNLLTLKCYDREIEVIYDIDKKLSNIEQKKIRMVKNTAVSLIKQLVIESVAILYQKVKLVGVGYRVFPVENFENCLLLLRLGYSHPIYFRVPRKTKISILKLTKLFLYGYSYQQLTFTASRIRLNKTPEPYKGKGILYDNEKIVLKEGKKI